MTKFLRDLIAIPSESCEEEGVIKRIAAEMEAVGFDKVEIDPEGNVLGWMGKGSKIIAYDAHIDTVGIGNIDNWNFDPYKGYENETEIGGRGGSDQEGGIVSSVYGAKIMLPKVQAAVKFAESKPGRTALITLLEKAKDGIAGKTGTSVHQTVGR